MQHTLEYLKCSGAGNDFVVLDAMEHPLPAAGEDLARTLCSRPFGIGADGLLVLERSSGADFLMKYFNADGSFGGMCGNGGRCIAMVAHRLGYASEDVTFEALGHTYSARIDGSTVHLVMKRPSSVRQIDFMPALEPSWQSWAVDTGAPHLVVKVPHVGEIAVAEIGRRVRWDKVFAPDGTNVNFMQVVGSQAIRIRTYERGVEAETLACGTGSVASATVAVQACGVTAPVTVHVQSGESVVVQLKPETVLSGSAHILFSGSVLYNSSSHTISPVRVRT